MRVHAVVGGDGPPLLLVRGWPQTWYQWRLMMPALARNFTVIAVDQRGIGLSDKPATGYDVGTLANDLVALMNALGYRRFAMVCTPGAAQQSLIESSYRGAPHLPWWWAHFEFTRIAPRRY